MTALPTQVRAVVIGGGIIGCSTAYHLAKLGWKDVVLIERNRLTSGSTWHAAGLVGQLRTSANITQLLKYSVELYDTLEQETGLATGWKRNGGLRLACNAERMTEIKRQATTAHSFGLAMELLSPQEAQKLWPVMGISDVVGAAFLPTDGQVNPADITQSLAKGARMGGVKIIEEVAVTGILIDKGRAVGVEAGGVEVGGRHLRWKGGRGTSLVRLAWCHLHDHYCQFCICWPRHLRLAGELHGAGKPDGGVGELLGGGAYSRISVRPSALAFGEPCQGQRGNPPCPRLSS
jgi:hypothetical protein